MEVQCHLMDQETVSIETEVMMELFVSIGEGLPHCLQPWACTVAKFPTPQTLTIHFVYISVSSRSYAYFPACDKSVGNIITM